jgi:hypothetical protein
VREAVQEQGERLETLAGELGLRAAEIEKPAPTWQALQDFPWGAAKRGGSEGGARWRGSVLPSDCAKAIHAVREAVGRFGEVAVAATVSHGVLRGAISAIKSSASPGALLPDARRWRRSGRDLSRVMDAPSLTQCWLCEDRRRRGIRLFGKSGRFQPKRVY